MCGEEEHSWPLRVMMMAAKAVGAECRIGKQATSERCDLLALLFHRFSYRDLQRVKRTLQKVGKSAFRLSLTQILTHSTAQHHMAQQHSSTSHPYRQSTFSITMIFFGVLSLCFFIWPLNLIEPANTLCLGSESVVTFTLSLLDEVGVLPNWKAAAADGTALESDECF